MTAALIPPAAATPGTALPTSRNLTKLPLVELLARRRRALALAAQEQAAALLFFSAEAIFYFTGAVLSPTERPICLILRAEREASLFVPFLEQEHAEAHAQAVNRVESYREYIGERHPMELLKDFLGALGLGHATITADSDGYPSIAGYRGPKLSQLCPDLTLLHRPFWLEELQCIKSPFDQDVLRESARWGCYAHGLLQRGSAPGRYELELVHEVKARATEAMLLALGANFVPCGLNETQARAIFRGQIGKLSYWPHVTAQNAMLCPGDNLITGARGFLFGCAVEMERTMFVGEPTAIQRRFYDHALAAQQLGLTAIRPGRRCSEVDRTVLAYYEENDLMPYWRHHTGHGIGFRGHERPFFDSHDETVLQPGMVFSVEPGFYVRDVGGFRISDTVLVTETGAELLTYYPKALEQMICPG